MKKKTDSIKKKTPFIKRKIKSIGSSEINVDKILIENFVSLQKVMTNLYIKFDDLTNQISKLLNLFEISAKVLAEKEFDLGKGNKDSKKIIEKIDNLLDQNKTIARGLILMHEKTPVQNLQESQYMQEPLQPPIAKQQIDPRQSMDMGGYQRSISSNPKFKPLPKN